MGFGGDETTNNRMEMIAVIEAIRANKSYGLALKVVSDSEYVINGCTKWLAKWKSSGWTKIGGIKNIDLWKSLDWEMQSILIEFEWVRGHSGDVMNERVDHLAEVARKRTLLRTSLVDRTCRSISWLKEQQ